MQRRNRTLRVVLMCIALAPASAAADDSLDDALAAAQKTERVLEDLARRVQPAVVNIRRFVRDEAWWTSARKGPGAVGWRVIPEDDLRHRGMRPIGGASGFLASDSGHVLTLRRVVIDPSTQRVADLIDVEFGASHYTATVLSLEPTLDLAILKIDPPKPVPFLAMGDSRTVRAGHWAIAFGNPDGAERTMIPGVVAYEPSRQCYQDEMSATYLQTSMRVPDGALGGPVVNLRGEVIGISIRRGDSGTRDSLSADAGSGYALPSDLARYIFKSLLERRSVDSPWLGISVRATSDELRKEKNLPVAPGIYIDNVFSPSPATRAGIKVGDILQTMDGEPVDSVYDFQRILYRLGAGSRAQLGILRGTRPLVLQAEITTRPREATTR